VSSSNIGIDGPLGDKGEESVSGVLEISDWDVGDFISDDFSILLYSGYVLGKSKDVVNCSMYGNLYIVRGRFRFSTIFHRSYIEEIFFRSNEVPPTVGGVSTVGGILTVGMSTVRGMSTVGGVSKVWGVLTEKAVSTVKGMSTGRGVSTEGAYGR
jgi:hypothetical protein